MADFDSVAAHRNARVFTRPKVVRPDPRAGGTRGSEAALDAVRSGHMEDV